MSYSPLNPTPTLGESVKPKL